jgi:hypothetical protein
MRVMVVRLWILLALVLVAIPCRLSCQLADPESQIRAHRIRCRILPASGEIQCTDTVTIYRPLPDAHRCHIRFHPINAHVAASVDGRDVAVTNSGGDFTIDGLPSDSVVEAVLNWSTLFSGGTEFSRITPSRAILRSEDVFPSSPGVIRHSRISITVPSGWSVVAPGSVVATDSVGEERTVTFESREGAPTLGWICAGRYRHDESVPGGTAISLCRFEDDSSDAGAIINLSRDVLGYLASRLTPYRYPSLTITEIDDWVGGPGVLAIAAPSLILVKKTAFTTTDSFNTVRSILPHEISHQWWALTVLPADDALPFLSEGMCEHFSILYNRSRGAATLRDSLGRHPLLRPLLLRSRQEGGILLHQKTDLRVQPALYLKGAYVHGMLAALLGDSCAGRLYRECARRFALRQITVADFESVAEEVSGRKLGWFFDEWLDKGLIPQLKCYNVLADSSQTGWNTRGRIRISGYQKFTIQVPVGIVSRGVQAGTTVVSLGIDSSGAYRNDVPFSIPTASAPDSLVVDPESEILKQQVLPPRLSDFRDPADVTMITGTGTDSRILRRMAERDSAVMENSGWNVRIISDSGVTLGDFQKPRVICYGTASANSAAARLEEKFTLRPERGRVKVNGEILNDSTLAVVQVIDNPFCENGLLGWVAPLGTAAQPEFLPYNASWAVVRGRDLIASGTWPSADRNLVVIPVREGLQPRH